jgi:dienelactone hydrolase
MLHPVLRRLFLVVWLPATALLVLRPHAATLALPAPTGQYRVAASRWIVTDPVRQETFAPGGPRRIEVIVWYPAAAGARPVPRSTYLFSGADEVRTFATLLGNRSALDELIDLKAEAMSDAPPLPGRRRLPLLLFSHGYTGVPSASNTLLQDLASHGYIVLSIVHPYEATASSIDSGVPALMLDASGKFHPQIQSVFDEWKTEDDVLRQVTSASDDEEQLRLLRGYLGRLTHTGIALQRWVDDVRTVVSQFDRVPRASHIARVLARAELGRFGVFGHSMGGVMAGEFCLGERRCAAALNLDGSPQYGSMIERTLGRPLMMVYSARPGRLGASDAIYNRAAAPYYRVDVADTRHLDFTDMVWWPALRARKITGAIEGDRAVAITRAVVREFFDQELSGRRSPLLAGTRPLAGVSIRRFGDGRR